MLGKPSTTELHTLDLFLGFHSEIGLAKLPRLALNLEPSCLSLLSSWDARLRRSAVSRSCHRGARGAGGLGSEVGWWGGSDCSWVSTWGDTVLWGWRVAEEEKQASFKPQALWKCSAVHSQLREKSRNLTKECGQLLLPCHTGAELCPPGASLSLFLRGPRGGKAADCSGGGPDSLEAACHAWRAVDLRGGPHLTQCG